MAPEYTATDRGITLWSPVRFEKLVWLISEGGDSRRSTRDRTYQSALLDQIADGCELNFVRGEPRPYPAEVVMNLNTGFGGKNACLILRRYSEEP